MRFKKHLEFEYGFKNLEIVSLVNLLFLVLLFFVVILNFVAEPGIRLSLGQVFTGESLLRGNVEISLPDNKSIIAGGRNVSDEELSEMLKFSGLHKQSVLIKTSRQTSLEKVIAIMNKCRDRGVKQVNIVTDNK